MNLFLFCSHFQKTNSFLTTCYVPKSIVLFSFQFPKCVVLVTFQNLSFLFPSYFQNAPFFRSKIDCSFMVSLQSIVEETLTSDEYVSLFLISILNIYVWNLNNCVPIGIIFKEHRTNWQPEKIMQVKRTNAPFLLLYFKWKHWLP